MSSNARHPSPLTGLLVNAAELLRRPGNWKDVEIDVESKHFEFEDPRLLPQLIGIHLHLECSNNGIVLSGNVSAQWHDQCCRCLKDISGVAVGEVGEIYQREITDPDAYRLESDQLNLAPMVREYVLLAVPDTPVCRPDCPGLCPVCGVDRSTPDGANCGCSQTPVDPRWDALRDLGSQFPQ